MTETNSMRDLRWLGSFILLAIAVIFGAWAFGRSVNLGVTAEEMRYNPVHDASWIASHNQVQTGATTDLRIAIVCLVVSGLASVMLFKSRATRITRVSSVLVGLFLVAGFGAALVLGMM